MTRRAQIKSKYNYLRNYFLILQAVPNDPLITSDDVSELKILIDRLECENQDLKQRLGAFKLAAVEKESNISHLQQENQILTEKLYQVQNCEMQNMGVNDNSSEISRLRQENVALTEQLKQTENFEKIVKLKQEINVLTEQRDQAVISEAQTSASLERLRVELSRLTTVTMELVKEVEHSQGVDKEKSIEIESLKKLCQFRRVSEVHQKGNDEVMKLKDMLAGLFNLVL